MAPRTETNPGAQHQARTRLWFALFTGPSAWALDSAVAYLLTQRACAVQSPALLLVFSALAVTLTIAGLVVALRAKHALPPRHAASGATHVAPTRFLVLSAVALNAGFLLAIIAAALPRLIIDPCI